MFLSSSSYCIVADYCQNAGIPNFGCQQPGNTYYYSPLAMYCFGICDASAVPEELNAFRYTEDQGLKVGNILASLPLYAFKKLRRTRCYVDHYYGQLLWTKQEQIGPPT